MNLETKITIYKASAMKAQKMRAITATNFVFIVRMY